MVCINCTFLLQFVKPWYTAIATGLCRLLTKHDQSPLAIPVHAKATVLLKPGYSAYGYLMLYPLIYTMTFIKAMMINFLQDIWKFPPNNQPIVDSWVTRT